MLWDLSNNVVNEDWQFLILVKYKMTFRDTFYQLLWSCERDLEKSFYESLWLIDRLQLRMIMAVHPTNHKIALSRKFYGAKFERFDI